MIKNDVPIFPLSSITFPGGYMPLRIFEPRYLDMVKNRYISTLIPLSKKQINQGIQEIDYCYKNKLKFKDKLNCIIL